MALFSEIFELTRGATVALIMSGDHDTGLMTVNVVPKPKEDHKEAGLSQDLTLVATPEEFDAHFLDAVRGYRAARSGLLAQAQTTVRVLEAATQASAASANAKGRGKREAARVESSNPTPPEVSGANTGQTEAAVAAETTAQADLFE